MGFYADEIPNNRRSVAVPKDVGELVQPRLGYACTRSLPRPQVVEELRVTSSRSRARVQAT